MSERPPPPDLAAAMKLAEEWVKRGLTDELEVVRLAEALLALRPVVEAALEWQAEFIGTKTSYDLRLEAAIDALAGRQS